MGQRVTGHDLRGYEPVSLSEWAELGRENEKPVTDAIPTPLPSWNKACRGAGGGKGLAPGWFVVVAGKTNSGKTILSINCVVSAMAAGKKVGYLSYEMSREELMTRILAAGSGVSVKRIERGDSFAMESFRQAVTVLDQRGMTNRLYLDDDPDRSVQGMRRSIAELVDMEGCELVVVDYVGLVGRGEHPQIFERTQLVSAALRETAKDLRTTILGLSQFNRFMLGQRKDEPDTAGLKGGSLDEDADQVLMLDYSQMERTTDGADTNLILGKNRHGPSGVSIPIRWDYRSLQVRERTSMDDAMAKIRARDGQ